MTRHHEFNPPDHLAPVAHKHTCERNGHEYVCYGPRHEHGSVRDCGSSLAVCAPKPKKEDGPK